MPALPCYRWAAMLTRYANEPVLLLSVDLNLVPV